MNKKIIILVFVGICLIGLLIGYFFSSDKNFFPVITKEKVQLTPSAKITPGSTSLINASPTVKPTWPPISERIKSISDKGIIVTGKAGDMNLPKDPTKIRVYKRSGDQLILGSFDDIKVDQEVTLKIITPGKLADLIIER